jgi:hypothetical protein
MCSLTQAPSPSQDRLEEFRRPHLLQKEEGRRA